MAILQLMSNSSVATAIESVEDMEVAAKGIYALGPAYVLLKGGHLAPSNTTGQCTVLNVLFMLHCFDVHSVMYHLAYMMSNRFEQHSTDDLLYVIDRRGH